MGWWGTHREGRGTMHAGLSGPAACSNPGATREAVKRHAGEEEHSPCSNSSSSSSAGNENGGGSFVRMAVQRGATLHQTAPVMCSKKRNKNNRDDEEHHRATYIREASTSCAHRRRTPRGREVRPETTWERTEREGRGAWRNSERTKRTKRRRSSNTVHREATACGIHRRNCTAAARTHKAHKAAGAAYRAKQGRKKGGSKW